MNKRILLSLLLFLLTLTSQSAPEDNIIAPFDIPYVDGITIDGKPDDWGGRGFRVDWMNVQNNNDRLKPEDFDPRFRIGWDQRGIFMLFSITDDIICEDRDSNLWEGDTIDVFITDNPVAERYTRIIVSPGLDAGMKNELRIKRQKNIGAEVEVARIKTEKGYICEMFMPWRNIGKAPAEGDVIFLQIYVNDMESGEKKVRYLFFPLEYDDAYYFRGNMHSLRLARAASQPIVSSNEARWNGKENMLAITGVPELAGKEFTVRSPRRELARGKMKSNVKQGGSFGQVIIPAPLQDEYLGDFEIEFSDGLKHRGVASAFKPINLCADLKSSESMDGNLKLSMDLADSEKNAGYYLVSPLTVRCIFIDENGKELPGANGKAGEDITLKVPGNGSYALLATLCDLDNDVLAGRVLSLANGKVVQPVNTDKASVIAVSGIGPFNWMMVYFKSFHLDDIFCLRDRISSILVHNYNCITLSRARGYNMAVENSINKINLLTSENTNPSDTSSLQVPAADFAVTGHYKFTGRQNPVYIDRDYTCEIMLNEISGPGKKFQKLDVASDPANYWKIAAPIIAAINPPPRIPLGPGTGRLDGTWAILPITIKGMALKSKELPLSVGIEIALQESGRISRLVSHDEMDRILLEMKIKSLDGATESLAGDIAKIAGADRVIMGTLSDYSNQRHQLNLFLVDGRNSVILESASAICLKSSLNDSASLLALKLTERKYESPALPPQSDEARKKEAEIYLKIEKASLSKEPGLKDDYRGKYLCLLYSHALSNLESAYYLAGSDQEQACRIVGGILSENLLEAIPAAEKLSLIQMVDNILRPIPPGEKTKRALSYRAAARIYTGIEYDEAAGILDEQKAKYPGLDEEYSCRLKIHLLYNAGKYDEAAAGIDALVKTYGRNTLCLNYFADVYRKTGDEKRELEILESIRNGKSAENLSRYVKLTAKFKGPEKAIALYENTGQWLNTDPGTFMELAKCYMATGNRSKAGAMLVSANKALEKYQGYYTKELKDEVTRLLAEVGDVKFEGQTAKQVRDFPDKYKLYIQPVGKNNMRIVNNAAVKAGEFFGTKIEVLPEIPLPEDDPYAFNKERGQYDSEVLIARVAIAAPVPRDAIWIFYVMPESIYYRKFAWNRGLWSNSYGDLTSTNPRIRDSDNLITGYIASKVSSSFLDQCSSCINLPEDAKQRKVKVCKNLPCLVAAPYDGVLSICDDCQKRYGQVDFDKAFNVFQNMRWPSTCNCDKCRITEDKKKYIDKYNQQVKDFLAKANKENEQKK
ncbi:MAG TPA: hypothetical protein DET40_21320 [Lentisphaeria bacterium]|nr:MAG: hypothetical protein A2X45_03230 [Lentisphaerae bacterium GWF2_50_93]HCE46093.1 hypothetical protein [Lentisphaeria bacterium]